MKLKEELQSKKYPYYGVFEGALRTVVKFISPKTGFNVQYNTNHILRNNWDEDKFRKLTEEELVNLRKYIKNLNKFTLYTVNECKKNNELYKISHSSDCGEFTVCGIPINKNWYITNNTFDGEITCKKCKKVLKQYPTVPQRIKEQSKNKSQ
jgi:hypothetical protein